MVDSDGGAATYEYEAANRLNQTVGNGVVTRFGYPAGTADVQTDIW